ncbi:MULTISPECIES: TIGR01906 family membrane protein [unclassified Streptococcus]|uniref:TIGR01906 family membrane protein n=1 Tax=unclassified Streptococcus TaxID=2608887 RepID=UPI0010722BBF|nr:MULTISPECIES: TIGR01906 family membrane protein [unclassified Streptococcus]MBF0786476.1 TIGR01906 family membrane protein [Streptococcus sp. 19428wC2_LYSM12]MCQ9212367.1 TIGR01906 family membrane protein [Streptococcus sp. B01]MCQ9213698.1 TIGR01906 family membrane protein [Streptococcus sp. O1]TFV06640.1 TIGR01906 family membrane protein [Streptococcus sp. LYSM12]
MKAKGSLVASLLFLLSAAIIVTICLVWMFYPLEIQWLGLEKIVYMKAADIRYNFNILLRYLTLPWEQRLSMANFRSSASGLRHFQQVKWLFHLAQVIFLMSLPGFLYFWKKIVKKGYGNLYQSSLITAAALPLLIAIFGMSVGFDSFFTLFHQVLFAGDSSWLFNPNTDPVIYILPAEFFLHCFLLFFVLYEGLCLGMILVCNSKRKIG